MFRRVMMLLGFKPCWVVSITVESNGARADGSPTYKVDAAVCARSWATREDLMALRAETIGRLGGLLGGRIILCGPVIETDLTPGRE